jgi:hypothetical protein
MTLDELAVELKFEIDESTLKSAKEKISSSLKTVDKELDLMRKRGLKDVFNVDTSQLFKVNELSKGIQNQISGIAAGVVAAFSVRSIYEFVKGSIEISENLERINIQLEALAGEKAINEIDSKFMEIKKSTNSWFSDSEFKTAAARFIQLGGTADEYGIMVDSLSKKAAIMGVSLVDAVEAFQLAAIKGNVTMLMRHGFIEKDTFDEFERTSVKMEENQRRRYAREIAYRSAIKMTDNQMRAFGKLMQSNDAAFRKFDNLIRNIRKEIGKTFAFLLKPLEGLINLLDKLANTKFGNSIIKILSLVGVIAGSIISMRVLIAVISMLTKSFGGLAAIMGMGALPFFLIITSITALVLIIEDLYVALKGGNSQLAEWGKQLQNWASQFPSIKQALDFIAVALFPILQFFSTGINTGWGDAFVEMLDYVGNSFKIWGDYIKGIWLDFVNFFAEKYAFIMSKIQAIPKALGFGGGEINVNNPTGIMPSIDANNPIGITPQNTQRQQPVQQSQPQNTNKTVSFTVESINISGASPENAKSIGQNIASEIEKYFNDQLTNTAFSFQDARVS